MLSAGPGSRDDRTPCRARGGRHGRAGLPLLRSRRCRVPRRKRRSPGGQPHRSSRSRHSAADGPHWFNWTEIVLRFCDAQCLHRAGRDRLAALVGDLLADRCAAAIGRAARRIRGAGESRRHRGTGSPHAVGVVTSRPSTMKMGCPGVDFHGLWRAFWEDFHHRAGAAAGRGLRTMSPMRRTRRDLRVGGSRKSSGFLLAQSAGCQA